MKINKPRSEGEALSASRHAMLTGWQDGVIAEASEETSRRGNPMMKVTVVVTDAKGTDRTFFDYLTDTDQCAQRLRHAAIAVGCLVKYEAGEELQPEDFAGRQIKIKLKTERRGGFTRSVIEDYRAAAASLVINLHRSAG